MSESFRSISLQTAKDNAEENDTAYKKMKKKFFF